MKPNHEYQLERWKLLIQNRRESGLGIREWCRQTGNSIHAYYYWLKLIRKENLDTALKQLPAQVEQQTPFVDVTPSKEPAKLTPTTYHEPISAAVIHCGDFQIDLLPNISEDFCRNLLKALRDA